MIEVYFLFDLINLLGILLPLGRYDCCVRATPAQLGSPRRKVPWAWQSQDPGTRDLQVWINKVLHEQRYGLPEVAFIAWNHTKFWSFWIFFCEILVSFEKISTSARRSFSTMSHLSSSAPTTTQFHTWKATQTNMSLSKCFFIRNYAFQGLSPV